MSKRKAISGRKCFENRTTFWLIFLAHLAQEPRARSPSRKRARLLGSGSHDRLPVQSGNKQRRENGQCRALLSSLATGSIRWNVSRDLCALVIAYLLEQRYPTLQSESNRELGQADIEPRTQTRNSKPAVFSPHLDFKKRLRLPRDNGFSNKQNLQFDETVQKTNPPATVSAGKPAKELGVQEVKQKGTRPHWLLGCASHVAEEFYRAEFDGFFKHQQQKTENIGSFSK